MKDSVSGVTPAPDDQRRVDGRAARWTEHRAARREELIDAAITAVNELGSDVGMDQIAAAASTSKPVIYRYFADKDELYRAVGSRVVRQIVVTLLGVRDDPDPQAMLRASIDAYLQLLEDNPQTDSSPRTGSSTRRGSGRPDPPNSAGRSSTSSPPPSASSCARSASTRAQRSRGARLPSASSARPACGGSTTRPR